MANKPILLKPAFKDYLWGGTKLRTQFGKQCDLDKIAESWELSAHKDGESTVASGVFASLSLSEYIDKCGKEILGSRAMEFENFPILIKLIDAKDKLSIQVHPSDEYALINEGEYGKTEVWYVMSAEEGASLYYGFDKEISKEEYKKRIEDNTITDVLKKVEAKKGDIFFIEPGTVHAIGAGLLICEVQQNSNTTYRVCDYARRGADGKLRELHIDKALDVSCLSPVKPNDELGKVSEKNGYTSELIAKCKYFTCEKITSNTKATLPLDTQSFRSVVVTDGSCALGCAGEALSLKAGDSVFIPAQNGAFAIEGECEFLLSYV